MLAALSIITFGCEKDELNPQAQQSQLNIERSEGELLTATYAFEASYEDATEAVEPLMSTLEEGETYLTLSLDEETQAVTAQVQTIGSGSGSGPNPNPERRHCESGNWQEAWNCHWNYHRMLHMPGPVAEPCFYDLWFYYDHDTHQWYSGDGC